jgi:DNA polymerase-1
MTTDKRLFLIDAMALIYRAHFAFIKNPRINSKGLNTSAIFGFMNSLLDIIDKDKPSHIAVAFDSHGPTFRHEEYVEYKANRDKQPEDISFALPVIKAILKAFHIPVIELQGFEADDIIGTLAKQASHEGYVVYMYTPDKDFAQLVEDDKIFLYKPGRMGNPPEVWNADKVKQEFGIIRIDQVVDIQGLMGDAVDNIPGVPGIGPKTAQKLIAEFDSIENLIKNADKIEGRFKELIQQHAEQALLSKKLATISLTVPVQFEEKHFKIDPPNEKIVEGLFAELEFRALGKRVLGKEPEKKAVSALPDEMKDLFNISAEPQPEIRTINTESKKYIQITSNEHKSEFIRLLKQQNMVSVHIDTNTSNPHNARLLSMAFCWKPEEAWHIRFTPDRELTLKFLNEISFLLSDPKRTIIGYNLKYLHIVLAGYGIEMNTLLFDNMIAHYIIDPETKHDFQFLTETYLSYKQLSTGLFSATEGFTAAACEEAELNMELSLVFHKIISENGMERLFFDVEGPMISVLAHMEMEGVKVDKDVLNVYSEELLTEMTTLEGEIYSLAGMTFNLNSPLQLGKVLFDILRIDDKVKKTKKSKQYSTSEDVLQKLAPNHEIVRKMLEYRSLQKLRSTYVEALPELIKPETGRIHTSYNQAITATGRLSSTNPNLQNIPIRTDKGRFIRKAFVPRNDDYVLLSADYSQIELRIIASISQDEAMIGSFRQNTDIHSTTAAKVFDVPLDQVTPEMRRKAKVVNFGIIYGISGWGLAERMGINRKEADEIISQYFIKFPGIKKYMDETIQFARENGYVKTLLGRKRMIRDINTQNHMQQGFAERNAINAPIQGSAADMIKIAMVNIDKKMIAQNLASKMIMQVHDELVFDCLKSEVDDLKKMVKEEMENALPLDVPVFVEMGSGANWLDAH